MTFQLLNFGPSPEQPRVRSIYVDNLQHVVFLFNHASKQNLPGVVQSIAGIIQKGFPHGAVQTFVPSQMYGFAFWKSEDAIELIKRWLVQRGLGILPFLKC